MAPQCAGSALQQGGNSGIAELWDGDQQAAATFKYAGRVLLCERLGGDKAFGFQSLNKATEFEGERGVWI
ncbi:hypothetical protein AK812_SmicGene32439 [Symbiodinium microadriaticum]|uniref:Uncharacterized protein n=1 Tax=Symbiodinium microadriaticum TaxID=2951 RepID=A0A1Q9CU79_SYMMI|nr:hypothetical protein AK812_SmicGene32439 [Symbiodinium microadriaticum]